MLSAAGMTVDPSIMKELEEDCKPDYTAEAIDELDIIAQDFESSSDNDDKDPWETVEFKLTVKTNIVVDISIQTEF